MTLPPALRFDFGRLQRDRGGAALVCWALAGALVAGLVGWSVALAEKESRGHSITQAAW